MLELFELDVPERVGATCGGADKPAPGAPYVLRPAPFQGRGPARRAPQIYDSASDLVDYVFGAAAAQALEHALAGLHDLALGIRDRRADDLVDAETAARAEWSIPAQGCPACVCVREMTQ